MGNGDGFDPDGGLADEPKEGNEIIGTRIGIHDERDLGSQGEDQEVRQGKDSHRTPSSFGEPQPMGRVAARQPTPHSMRYLTSVLLLFFVLLGPLTPQAQAASGKRRAAKQSSLPEVRKKPKYNRKPNVYSAKRNRPLVAHKKHWWQKR